MDGQKMPLVVVIIIIIVVVVIIIITTITQIGNQVVLQIDSFYLNCYSWFTVLTSYTWNEVLIQLV